MTAWSWPTEIRPVEQVFYVETLTARFAAALSGQVHVAERPGARLVSSANRFDDDQRWQRIELDRAAAGVSDLPAPRVERLRSPGGGRQRVVFSWYWVAGGFTGSAGLAKLRQLVGALLPDRPAMATLAVAVDTEPGDNPVSAAWPPLEAFLDAGGNWGARLARINGG